MSRALRRGTAMCRLGRRGVTLTEVVMASVTGALLAAGTLTSFVLAVRVRQRSTLGFEALGPALATIERERNRVNCLNAMFVPPCTPIGVPPGTPGIGATTYRITPIDAGPPVGHDYFEVEVRTTYDVP